MPRPLLRSRAQRRFTPRLEALESRYAPSCSWNSATNVLNSTGNNAVEIRTTLTSMWIYCNGSLMAFGADTDGGMTYAAGSGANSLSLTNPESYVGSFTAANTYLSTSIHNYTANFNTNVQNVSIYTGSGNDAVKVIPGHLFTTPTFTVNGQPGTDTLTIDDSGYGSGSSWKITNEDACVGVTNPHCIYFGSFNSLALTTGAGDDLVTIGNYLNTFDYLPHISVVGGGGTDTVVGIDSAYPYGDTYQPGPLSLYMPTKGIVFEYYQVENLTLKTGSGNDSITVSQAGNFLFPYPKVTVNAGGGIDTLTADDSGTYSLGITYKVTDVDVCRLDFVPPCVGYDNNLENFTLKTGSGNESIIVSGSGNQLFDKPLVYVNPGEGFNSLTVDDSGRATDEAYLVTESDVILPNTFGQTVIYPNGKIQALTLKTGAGVDDITVSNSVGSLAQLPDINVDGGGGGVNILRVSDAAYLGGDTYNVTNNQVSMPNSLGLIATYSNIYYLWLEVGTGNDTVNVGNSDGTVTGIPILYVLDVASSDSDVINVNAPNNPSATAYDVELATNNGYIGAPGWFTQFWYTEQLNLYAGMGDDTIDIAKANGELLAMGVGVFGGGGTNLLSIYDNKNVNAATYTVASSGPGAGSLDVSAPAFTADYQSINVVNLHRSLKPGTIVDKSGYNPADYVLNVIPARPVSNNPADGDPVSPPSPLNRPPMPAPPIRDPQAAPLAPQAQSVARRVITAVDQASAVDLVFGDNLADPLRSSVLSR